MSFKSNSQESSSQTSNIQYNEIHHQRGYEVTIPMSLIDDMNAKLIEPSIIGFYGIIRNLMLREGYCYAKNSFLAQQMVVDTRTIQRWLKALVDRGYLFCEVYNEGFKNKRKIWLHPEYLAAKERLKKQTKNSKNVCEGDKNVVVDRASFPRERCHDRSRKFYSEPMSSSHQYSNEENSLNEERKREKEKESAAPPSSADASALSNFLLLKIHKMYPTYKISDQRRWFDEIEGFLKNEAKDLTYQEIIEVLEWQEHHPFFKKIVKLVTIKRNFQDMRLEFLQDQESQRIKKHKREVIELKKCLNLPHMSIQSTGVVNEENSKDVSYNMPSDQFEKQVCYIFDLSQEQ